MIKKIFFVFLLLQFISTAQALTYSNSKSSEFVVKNGYHVKLSNQHGNITIIPVQSDTLSIEINLTAEFEILGDSAEFFSSIGFNLNRIGTKVYAETLLSSSFDYHIPYQINYTIHAPDSLIWEISHKFGNLECPQELNISDLNFEYGILRLPGLRKVNETMSNYNFVQCTLHTDTIDAALMNSEGSTLNIGYGSELIVRSEFSRLNINDLKQGDFTSYTDQVVIGKGSDIKFNSSYSNLDLRSPSGDVFVEMNYGKLNVTHIFKDIHTLNFFLNKVENLFSINNQTNLLINAELKYCDFKNSANISTLKRINDGSQKSYSGSLGKGSSESAILTIVSKFEDVDLRIIQ